MSLHKYINQLLVKKIVANQMDLKSSVDLVKKDTMRQSIHFLPRPFPAGNDRRPESKILLLLLPTFIKATMFLPRPFPLGNDEALKQLIFPSSPSPSPSPPLLPLSKSD